MDDKKKKAYITCAVASINAGVGIPAAIIFLGFWAIFGGFYSN